MDPQIYPDPTQVIAPEREEQAAALSAEQVQSKLKPLHRIAAKQDQDNKLSQADFKAAEAAARELVQHPEAKAELLDVLVKILDSNHFIERTFAGRLLRTLDNVSADQFIAALERGGGKSLEVWSRASVVLAEKIWNERNPILDNDQVLRISGLLDFSTTSDVRVAATRYRSQVRGQIRDASESLVRARSTVPLKSARADLLSGTAFYLSSVSTLHDSLVKLGMPSRIDANPLKQYNPGSFAFQIMRDGLKEELRAGGGHLQSLSRVYQSLTRGMELLDAESTTPVLKKHQLEVLQLLENLKRSPVEQLQHILPEGKPSSGSLSESIQEAAHPGRGSAVKVRAVFVESDVLRQVSELCELCNESDPKIDLRKDGPVKRLVLAYVDALRSEDTVNIAACREATSMLVRAAVLSHNAGLSSVKDGEKELKCEQIFTERCTAVLAEAASRGDKSKVEFLQSILKLAKVPELAEVKRQKLDPKRLVEAAAKKVGREKLLEFLVIRTDHAFAHDQFEGSVVTRRDLIPDERRALARGIASLQDTLVKEGMSRLKPEDFGFEAVYDSLVHFGRSYFSQQGGASDEAYALAALQWVQADPPNGYFRDARESAYRSAFKLKAETGLDSQNFYQGLRASHDSFRTRLANEFLSTEERDFTNPRHLRAPKQLTAKEQHPHYLYSEEQVKIPKVARAMAEIVQFTTATRSGSVGGLHPGLIVSKSGDVYVSARVIESLVEGAGGDTDTTKSIITEVNDNNVLADVSISLGKKKITLADAKLIHLETERDSERFALLRIPELPKSGHTTFAAVSSAMPKPGDSLYGVAFPRRLDNEKSLSYAAVTVARPADSLVDAPLEVAGLGVGVVVFNDQGEFLGPVTMISASGFVDSASVPISKHLAEIVKKQQKVD